MFRDNGSGTPNDREQRVIELVAQGLRLAELEPATQAYMKSWAPPEASLHNPIDLTPQGSLEDYRRAMYAVLADGGVDAAIAIYVPPVRVDEVDVARAIWQTALHDAGAAHVEIQSGSFQAPTTAEKEVSHV